MWISLREPLPLTPIIGCADAELTKQAPQRRLQVEIEIDTGGEGGIRTHGGFAPTPDFESGTFDHSATSPAVFYPVKSAILAETESTPLNWDGSPL